MSVYLEPAVAGIPWLLDPSSDRLRSLAREAAGRTQHAVCDPEALARDSRLLRDLVGQRHFGVAAGRVEPAELDEVFANWERCLARHPQTWGAATAGLQADLRRVLRDRHVRIFGAPNDLPDAEGPAVEARDVGGVLVLRVRRLLGDPADERALAAWVAGADRHFAYARIVVDLRGNRGGNDGHTYAWARRRLRAAAGFVRTAGWAIGGVPLGSWNAAAWAQARDGLEDVPPALLAGRHVPSRRDVLAVVEEEHAIEPGDLPWDGRMVVLVDRGTRSSGESSAWLLRRGLGATLAGEPTAGMIEYGNIVPYVLPGSELVIHLPTKSNDFGFPVEEVGFPVDVPLGIGVTAADVARDFDAFI